MLQNRKTLHCEDVSDIVTMFGLNAPRMYINEIFTPV